MRKEAYCLRNKRRRSHDFVAWQFGNAAFHMDLHHLVEKSPCKRDSSQLGLTLQQKCWRRIVVVRHNHMYLVQEMCAFVLKYLRVVRTYGSFSILKEKEEEEVEKGKDEKDLFIYVYFFISFTVEYNLCVYYLFVVNVNDQTIESK